MLSYNTFVDYASASPAWLPGELVEECFGRDAAKAGNVQRTAAGWLIKDGDYRPATTLEIAGIDSAMVKMAEALASFAGYDEIEALDITLAGRFSCCAAKRLTFCKKPEIAKLPIDKLSNS